jgi:hypothetical protein
MFKRGTFQIQGIYGPYKRKRIKKGFMTKTFFILGGAVLIGILLFLLFGG